MARRRVKRAAGACAVTRFFCARYRWRPAAHLLMTRPRPRGTRRRRKSAMMASSVFAMSRNHHPRRDFAVCSKKEVKRAAAVRRGAYAGAAKQFMKDDAIPSPPQRARCCYVSRRKGAQGKRGKVLIARARYAAGSVVSKGKILRLYHCRGQCAAAAEAAQSTNRLIQEW